MLGLCPWTLQILPDRLPLRENLRQQELLFLRSQLGMGSCRAPMGRQCMS